MRRGTCCKSRCEQSTVWPVHVQTRGHFWSMLLIPWPPMPVFAKFVPCTKIPTLPTLLNVPNDESPLPNGIDCNSNITKLVVVAFTTQLSGGFFIFDIVSHIWLLSHPIIYLSVFWYSLFVVCVSEIEYSIRSFNAFLSASFGWYTRLSKICPKILCVVSVLNVVHLMIIPVVRCSYSV